MAALYARHANDSIVKMLHLYYSEVMVASKHNSAVHLVQCLLRHLYVYSTATDCTCDGHQ